MAMMLGYLYDDKDNLAQGKGQDKEKKRGKHWVPTEHCTNRSTIERHLLTYLKEKQFPRQSKRFNRDAGFADTNAIQIEYWDVSEYAKSNGVFVNKGARIDVDDLLFADIGFPGETGTEFIRGDFDVICTQVNKKLVAAGQPLKDVALSTLQYMIAVSVLSAVSFHNKKTILAELCARFGKTIWAAALAVEMDIPLTVVATYVLTSFTSFENELSKFEQFKNIVVVDSKSPTYQTDVLSALAAGKQVVVFVSMCKGSVRETRIDFLFGLDTRRLVVVDEADYGVHHKGQADMLINARHEDDIVILMTGTNGDRAVAQWQIDHYENVTYAEMVMQKRQTQEQLEKY